MTSAFIEPIFYESDCDFCIQSNIFRLQGKSGKRFFDGLIRHRAVIGVAKCRIIGMDSTAIESNIQEPSGSCIMYDSISAADQFFPKMRKEMRSEAFAANIAKDAKNFVLRIMMAVSREEFEKAMKCI